MDQSKITGNWKMFTGRVKEQWGAVTDDDLRESEGHLEYLAGKIEARTGESRDQVRRKLREIEAGM